MSTQAEELEEVKSLARHHLPSIVWPIRLPKDSNSFVEELASHIRNKFNETSLTKFSKELQEFSNLRNIALSSFTENSFRDTNSLRNLKKYYCQLASMIGRFKECNAKFSWKDSFGRGTTEGNLEFEINNIMYNIAAIHSELGAKISRNTESSTKEACSHFTSALWWVTELRDNRTGIKPKEMGHDLLTFFHHVLKAQAQECVLTHSMRAGMKFENVAKIAAQIVSDYEIATKLAQSPLYSDPLREVLHGASIFHTWRATVEYKQKYFYSLTQTLSGLSYRDDVASEIGSRIARLKIATRNMEPCKKMLADTLEASAMKAATDSLESLMAKKLDKAIRYNDNVYHSQIPAEASLAQIDGKLLIGPAPFSISSIPDYKDLFSSLVTIEAVQTNSIYSQKKDDLSRQIKSDVEKQDEELANMMSTLDFDRRSMRLGPIETPDDLIEICAELSMNPNIVDDVLTKLEDIDDKSDEILRMLDAAESMIKKRPNAQFSEELKRFKSTHEEALRTTQSLHKNLYPELQQKIQLMSTTNDPVELLPKFSESDLDEDRKVVKRLESLLVKVDQMKQERANLLSQLSRSLDQDDVIKHVVAAASEHELKSIFDKEFQKHNKFLEPLMSNLKGQNELLDMLEQVNAQYGEVKLNHRSKREAYKERAEALKKYYSQFKVTSEGIDQGLEYNRKMVEHVRKFYQKISANNEINDLLN